MRDLYPAIEPFHTEMLDVGDGQTLYVEECGNPDGKPAVFLHGGPGSGCSPEHRQQFDPELYHVVLFDQRGAGRSTPRAGADFADLTANTTWHLVADIEAIREHLGIESWLVFGGSWGSTLALAYAQTHPERVTELVLRGIFTLRHSELAWFYEGGSEHGGGASSVLPDWWEDYVAPIAPERRGRLIEAYWEVLNGTDEGARLRAADAWTQWESRAIHLLPEHEEELSQEELLEALGFARIENHYFSKVA